MSAYPKRIVRRSTVLTTASFLDAESTAVPVQYQGGDLTGPLVVGLVRCKRKSGATNTVTIRGYNDLAMTVELFEVDFAALADEETDSFAFTWPAVLGPAEVLHVTAENGAADASTAEVSVDFEVTAG